jgi:hypothetical protein
MTNLLAHHRAQLEQESGISPEIIEARGYRSSMAKTAAPSSGNWASPGRRPNSSQGYSSRS